VKRYAKEANEMYVNTFYPISFKFQYNFKDSNACVTFSVFFFHGHEKNTIFKDKI